MVEQKTIDEELFLDTDMEAPRLLPVATGTAAVFSARCPGKQTANEDAAAVIAFNEQAAVLLVADGVGGGAAGEHAARIALEAFREAIVAARETSDLLRTAIINGFELANANIQELGVGAATTLAAVEIDDRSMRPYHVGDSEILVTGNRGKLKLRTVSHSPVAYGLEAGLLNTDEAMNHEDRHVVSNLVGNRDMRIDIGPQVNLRPRDTIVLATDGLFDNLNVEETVELCRKGPLKQAARRLLKRLQARMADSTSDHPSKPDDAAFILYRPLPAKPRSQKPGPPETDAPEPDAPKSDAPKSDAPKSNAPKSETKAAEGEGA